MFRDTKTKAAPSPEVRTQLAALVKEFVAAIAEDT